jgi:Tol biopolymer transport system component
MAPLVSGPDLSAYTFTSLSRDEAEERSPRWSPDGKSIVYTAQCPGDANFTRLVGSADGVQLTERVNCFVPSGLPARPSMRLG